MSSSTESTALPRDSQVIALLEAAGVWMWETDLPSETTSYQPGFWEQYGYETEALTETFEFLRVVDREDIPAIVKAWRAHLEDGAPFYQAEWRLRTASGAQRWISARGKVFKHDEQGRPLKIAGIYRDVTEAHEAEASRASSLAELDAIFRSARHGLGLVAPDLTILRLNDRARELVQVLTGRESREGDGIVDVPNVLPNRPVLSDIKAVLAGRTVADRTLFINASQQWIELSYVRVDAPGGSVGGVAVMLRDVTEQRRLEQSRVHALRLESMGLLASGIAHDFNNLLGAIVGNIDVALMDVADPEVSEPLGDARAAAQRAAELVQQLLAFADQHEPIVRPVDVSKLTAEIVRYARRIPGPEVSITEELAPDLPEIDADATQIRQLVLNLVVNAIDATKDHDGGHVHVRTAMVARPSPESGELVLQPRPAPAYLMLEVSDDGEGMDASTLAHMFDPFFTTKPNGHGLGLATVLSAVRTHGGTLAARSLPGKGATFTVYLPAAG